MSNPFIFPHDPLPTGEFICRISETSALRMETDKNELYIKLRCNTYIALKGFI